MRLICYKICAKGNETRIKLPQDPLAKPRDPSGTLTTEETGTTPTDPPKLAANLQFNRLERPALYLFSLKLLLLLPRESFPIYKVKEPWRAVPASVFFV